MLRPTIVLCTLLGSMAAISATAAEESEAAPECGGYSAQFCDHTHNGGTPEEEVFYCTLYTDTYGDQEHPDPPLPPEVKVSSSCIHDSTTTGAGGASPSHN